MVTQNYKRNRLLTLFACMVLTFALATNNEGLFPSSVYSQQPQQQQLQFDDDNDENTTLPAIGNLSSLNHVPSILNVSITSHTPGQVVLVGNLTVFGMSTDTPSTNCEVYTKNNNNNNTVGQSFQKVVALGNAGIDDYSNWTFTYPTINLGDTNELVTKMMCANNPSNITVYNTLNITGVTQQQQQLDSQVPPFEGANQTLIPSPAPPPLVSEEEEEANGDEEEQQPEEEVEEERPEVVEAELPEPGDDTIELPEPGNDTIELPEPIDPPIDLPEGPVEPPASEDDIVEDIVEGSVEPLVTEEE